MDRAQKAESIETLKGVFEGAGAVVVTHYLGLTVAEMTDLRGRLRSQGAKLKVVKNRLVHKAMEGRTGEAGEALFKGPVAIAYAPDPVSAAKVVTQYAKDNDKLVILGGAMGRAVLDSKGVKALAFAQVPVEGLLDIDREAHDAIETQQQVGGRHQQGCGRVS